MQPQNMEHHMEIRSQYIYNRIYLLRMKNRYLHIILVSLCSIFFLSCETDNNDLDESSGSIYGVVADFSTGEPVANANVSLRPGGETTLTGYDGMYEFLDVADGNHTIIVSKTEYTDLIDDYVISIKNGRRMRRDVQIKKLPTSLRITDTNGSDITFLDFGSELSVINKPFNIFNNGTVSISCSLIYSCNWIKSVTSIPDKITPGQNVTVNVEIDRSQLKAGNNATDLYVISNNGSNVLKINATGQEHLPNVLTMPVTYIDGTITPWCNTFHARVTEIGNPAYHTRGFCFSSTNLSPTINDNRIDVSGTGIGEYSYTYWNIPPNTVKYYVRAWVMYGKDNKIQYGEVQSFVYNDV